MTRIVVAGSILGLVCLTAGQARASSLGEVSAATGVHNTLAGTGASSAHGALDAVKRNVPKGSTCKKKILSDYGKRVAAEHGRKGKSGKAWATAGSSGGGRGKVGTGWASASSASTRAGKSGWGTSKASASGSSGWETAGGKSRKPAPRRR